MRERVRQVTLTEKNAAENVALFARYYRVITTMRSRFGSAIDESDANLQFTWRDAFKQHDKCSLHDLQVAVCVSARLSRLDAGPFATHPRGEPLIGNPTLPPQSWNPGWLLPSLYASLAARILCWLKLQILRWI